MYTDLVTRAEELRSEIVAIRRDFHMSPEVGLRTFETAQRIAERLEELGIETRMLVDGAGLVGLLEGSKPGKTFALRADIDALPVQEQTDLPYKSRVDGKMHACGHDAHAAMLIGAASILSEFKTELKGNVAFIFQPAEETGEGAKAMVEDGALESVDQIAGLHVISTMPSGIVGYRSGPFLAAGDFFEATIIGRGGHGAWPSRAIDPIVIAANAISALQTIVSRETHPLESTVVSVCQINGGSTYNVIPESVSFGGTIRTHDAELRDSVPKRVEQIITGVAEAMGATCTFELMRRFPLTDNDPEVTEFAVQVAKRLVGEDKIQECERRMGSEDFSYYLQEVPGTFLYLGCGDEEKGTTFAHHHPKFNVDEDVLPLGTALEVTLALEYLNR